MTGRKTKIAFGSLAALGIALGLLGVTVELYGAIVGKPMEVPHPVYWGAMLFGFIGFFGLNPDRAERGANVATNVVTRILEKVVPRFGRRSTDAVAIPETETTTTAVPVKPLPRDEADGIEPTP